MIDNRVLNKGIFKLFNEIEPKRDGTCSISFWFNRNPSI